MPQGMKSETREEAKARLQALIDAEKAGAQAASEGQLQPVYPSATESEAAVDYSAESRKAADAAPNKALYPRRRGYKTK